MCNALVGFPMYRSWIAMLLFKNPDIRSVQVSKLFKVMNYIPEKKVKGMKGLQIFISKGCCRGVKAEILAYLTQK